MTHSNAAPDAATFRDRQTILARFGEFALRSSSLDHILHEACRLVAEALGTPLAKVMDLQADGVTLCVRAGVGWKPGVVGVVSTKAEGDTPERYALETGLPTISGDSDHEDRFVYADFLQDHGVRAFVNVQIIGPRGTAPFGILEVDSLEPRAFDDDDISFLQTYANLLAAAVDRLHGELEAQNTGRALRQSEQRLRALVSASSQALYAMNADWSEMRHLDGGGFIADTGTANPDWLEAYIHLDDQPAVRLAIERAIRTETPFQLDHRVRLVNGGWGWTSSRAVPVYDGDSRITGWFGAAADITERRQMEDALHELTATLEQRVAARTRELLAAEEALRQSQKMEAIGQLTGGVAHDFNNLLTIIRSSVDYLRRSDLTEARRRRYLDAASDTVDRAAKLTGQLLAFARRQALTPEVFDVRAKLLGVVDMLVTVMGARVKLVTDLPDTSCFVRADLSQFETALVNMAVNARDAMAGEGLLRLGMTCGVPMPPIRGHADARGAFIAVCISDSGAGITADQIAHIFEPFYTTKEVGQGTGLGLSQVFGFAKQSGGDIDVTSTPGEGASFTLYLPQVEAGGVSNPREERDDAAGGHGQCILVVEDNIEVGQFSTQILEDLGYRTTWAANAEEALEILGIDGAGFDAVFSDVVMPGMGGLALAQELGRRLPHLPVLLTSGYSHVLAQNDQHGFELLHKPYSAEQLSTILRRVTARASAPKP